MSSAVRVAVPLNSMCSTKCAMPLCSADSCREPRVSHTPMLTERTCVISSVRIRSPLSNASRTIGVFDKVENTQKKKKNNTAPHQTKHRKPLTRKELHVEIEI